MIILSLEEHLEGSGEPGGLRSRSLLPSLSSLSVALLAPRAFSTRSEKPASIIPEILISGIIRRFWFMVACWGRMFCWLYFGNKNAHLTPVCMDDKNSLRTQKHLDKNETHSHTSSFRPVDFIITCFKMWWSVLSWVGHKLYLAQDIDNNVTSVLSPMTSCSWPTYVEWRHTAKVRDVHTARVGAVLRRQNWSCTGMAPDAWCPGVWSTGLWLAGSDNPELWLAGPDCMTNWWRDPWHWGPGYNQMCRWRGRSSDSKSPGVGTEPHQINSI